MRPYRPLRDNYHCGEFEKRTPLAMPFSVAGTTPRLISAALRLGEALRVHPATCEHNHGKLDAAIIALRGLPAPWTTGAWGFGFRVFLPDKSRKLYWERAWFVTGSESKEPPHGKILEIFSHYFDPECAYGSEVEKAFSCYLDENSEDFDRGGYVDRWISDIDLLKTYDAIRVEIDDCLCVENTRKSDAGK
jgi:hypothetical protein